MLGAIVTIGQGFGLPIHRKFSHSLHNEVPNCIATITSQEREIRKMLAKQNHSLCRLKMFDSFVSPALLQTQQAVLQQRIRNQVVVIFNLRLAEMDAAVTMWTWVPFSKLQYVLLRQINPRHISAHSLAEDKGEVVLGLFLMAQVLETQSFQEAEQTLIIYGKLISCNKKKNKKKRK